MDVANMIEFEGELNGYGNGGRGDGDGMKATTNHNHHNDLNGDASSMKQPTNAASAASASSLDHADRVKNKTKRIVRQTYRGDGSGLLPTVNGITSYIAPQRRWKNSRRSRKLCGRGLPKKGGAGGKGVWGLLGSELLEFDDEEDQNDPNYDPELNDRNIELKEVIPVPTQDEFNELITPIILEYFQCGDTHEVMISLEEILLCNTSHMVTSAVIEIAMEHKNSRREMTSLLISDLYGRLLTAKDIAKGFEGLLENLPDLMLDTPEAPTILSNFIARAVADDCLAPCFLTNPDVFENLNVHAKIVLERAGNLLNTLSSWVLLDNIWGSGGPLRPVKYITKEMAALLKEFIASRDLEEAHRCVKALEVPHYCHELVYEAIVIALEATNQQTSDAMCEFLASVYKACLISPTLMEQGFQRVFDDMPDIVLDVPLAYIMLDRFIQRCYQAGFLTDGILNNVPNRGRKRFVSEGDGGLIKTPIVRF